MSKHLTDSSNPILNYIQSSSLMRDAILLISWLVVWYSSALVEYTAHASVWFPPAGLTFAAMFLLGIRAIPALMVAALFVTFQAASDYQIPLNHLQLIKAGLLFGIAHILPYYLASKFLRWFSHYQQLNLPQFIISFLLVAAVASLLTTFLVLAALIVSQMMPAESLNTTWLPFWIGDMAGIIVLTPLFSGFLSKVYPDIRFEITDLVGEQTWFFSTQSQYKLLICVVLTIASMLLAKYTGVRESAFAIFFLVIPHMWIACTENALFNSVSLAVNSVLIALLVHVLGLMEFVMVYQFAINIVAANAMFGLALPKLAADNLQLREMAYTDSLTRVASREHIKQRGDLEIRRSQWEHLPLSLLVFDIDHFKHINDEYGHRVGDHALQLVSETAQQSLRPSDILGRFGGDEFVVLLPDTDAMTAEQVAGRILERINHATIPSGEKLSVSIGVTQMQQSDSFDNLFERADKALYQAKRAGRNCVFS